MMSKGYVILKMSPNSNSQSNPKLKSHLNHQLAQSQIATDIINYLTIAKELLKEHRQKGH